MTNDYSELAERAKKVLAGNWLGASTKPAPQLYPARRDRAGNGPVIRADSPPGCGFPQSSVAHVASSAKAVFAPTHAGGLFLALWAPLCCSGRMSVSAFRAGRLSGAAGDNPGKCEA